MTVDITGLLATQKSANGTKFLSLAEAQRRNCLAPGIHHHIKRLARSGRGTLKIGAQAVGVKGARQQVVDGYPPPGQAAARHPGHKTGQAAARAVGQAKRVDGRLDRTGGDVDDAPKAALGHSVHRGLDEIDGGEHVGIDGAQPGVAVPVAKISWRWPARVGHHDVKLLPFGKHRSAAFSGGDVGGHKQHLGAVGLGIVGRQSVCGLLQCIGSPSHHHQVHTLAHQRLCATKTQPFAGATHQRPFASDTQIHVVPLVL